jgi:hypothetical protein
MGIEFQEFKKEFSNIKSSKTYEKIKPRFEKLLIKYKNSYKYFIFSYFFRIFLK